MIYLFDTNILLGFLKGHTDIVAFRNTYRPFSNGNTAILSVVSVGEIKSISLRNGWGERKNQQLYDLISLFLITDINADDLINKYAEIDTYSQGKLRQKPIEGSAKNMGKNDLWIAATASVTKAILVTSDKDFIHLDGVYFDIYNPLKNDYL